VGLLALPVLSARADGGTVGKHIQHAGMARHRSQEL